MADYASYARLAHLSYVALPGGDAGVRNPCRMALSHLRSAGAEWTSGLPSVRACRDDELALLDRQLEPACGCVPDLEHGPALRRGRLARGRLPPGGVRRPGRDGARGAGPSVRRRERLPIR